MLRSYRSLALALAAKVSNPNRRLPERSTRSLPRQPAHREVFGFPAVAARMGREGGWRTASGPPGGLALH